MDNQQPTRVRVRYRAGFGYFRVCSPIRSGLVVTQTETGTYTVTHRESGRKLPGEFARVADARRVMTRLLAMPLDWTLTYRTLKRKVRDDAALALAMQRAARMEEV